MASSIQSILLLHSILVVLHVKVAFKPLQIIKKPDVPIVILSKDNARPRILVSDNREASAMRVHPAYFITPLAIPPYELLILHPETSVFGLGILSFGRAVFAKLSHPRDLISVRVNHSLFPQSASSVASSEKGFDSFLEQWFPVQIISHPAITPKIPKPSSIYSVLSNLSSCSLTRLALP
jgi:hypothetical protein